MCPFCFGMRKIEDLQIGDFKIYQDDELYKFTSDSILLSKFTAVKKGDVVADFCSGSGIVGLHLYALNPVIKSVHLFEMQSAFSVMAGETIKLNALEEKFVSVNAKIQDIGANFNGYFSLIVCNPPYMKKGSGFESDFMSVCKQEICLDLETLVKVSAKKLKFGGRLNMVHRADRVAEIFKFMQQYGLEPKKLQFVSGEKDKEPYLLLVEAVKGGKPGVKVLRTILNDAVGLGK